MNALFERFKNDYTLMPEKNLNLQLKDCYIYQNINAKENNTQLNIFSNERINLLAQTLKELNIQYVKERQNIILNNGNNNNSIKKNEISGYKSPISQESKENYVKNSINSLSEVKKFKTELCHSWELTGTCKYGLNVIYKIYNIF